MLHGERVRLGIEVVPELARALEGTPHAAADLLGERDDLLVGGWGTGTKRMEPSSPDGDLGDHVVGEIGGRLGHAPPEGQKPRRLQLNPTTRSWRHRAHRTRKKPLVRIPQSRKSPSSFLTNRGSVLSPSASTFAMNVSRCRWSVW